MRQWQELAEALKTDDPDDRHGTCWRCIAPSSSKTTINDRRQFVLKQLELAEDALRAGRPNEAIAIKSKLIDQYSRYTDLADLFPAPPAGPRRPSSAAGSAARSRQSSPSQPDIRSRSPATRRCRTRRTATLPPRRSRGAARRLQAQDTRRQNRELIRSSAARFAHFARSRPTVRLRIP